MNPSSAATTSTVVATTQCLMVMLRPPSTFHLKLTSIPTMLFLHLLQLLGKGLVLLPAAVFFQSKGNASPKEANVHLVPGFKLKRLAAEHAIDLLKARREALHLTAGIHLSKADIHLLADNESADDEEDSC